MERTSNPLDAEWRVREPKNMRQEITAEAFWCERKRTKECGEAVERERETEEESRSKRTRDG